MPAYIATKETLSKLRKRASMAKINRDIECGKWERFLIQMGNAVHAYKDIKSHSGKIGPLVTKINVVRMSIRYHSTVLAGTPITATTDDGFDAQHQALTEIRSRSMFDALLMQSARRANIEAFSTMRVAVGPLGTHICADDNCNVLPVGPDGPDMQPTVWERRWVIDRETTVGGVSKKEKFLRVERHRAPGGVGVVEQEVYKTASDDIYQYLPDLKELDLDVVLPDSGLIPSIETGVSHPLITRFVHEYYDGQPEPLMSEHDLDMIDMIASAMSRVDRSMELHGMPKVRISEEMIDKKTGKANITQDAIVDPEKIFEYVVTVQNLVEMLAFMGKMLQLGFAQLQLSPALVGIKLEGGAMPDTVDKLRLEASNTLARGRTSSMYFGPALSRVFQIASAIDSTRPMQGYPVGAVGVTMHTGLPRDPIDIAREMQELRGGGTDPLIDLLTALQTIHGPSAGMAIHKKLKEEKDEQLVHEQAALMGAIPAMPGAQLGVEPGEALGGAA